MNYNITKMIRIIFLSVILFSGSLVGTINVDVFAQQNNSNEKKNDNANEKSNGKANANKLTQIAQNKGHIKIIVEVDTAFTPEGKFSTALEKMNQRAKIKNDQDALLSELPTSQIIKSHKYTYTPYIAMTVNLGVLQHLLDSPMVISIQHDEPEFLTLGTTTGTVDADPEAYALGFTGAGQTVAILDSGVKSSHPFLGGGSTRVIYQACFTNNNSTNASGDPLSGTCPNGLSEQFGTGAAEPCFPNSATNAGNAGCYHGTHVAGIAAGSNTAGTSGAPDSGIAKDAKIMAYQVFTEFTGGPGCGAACIGSFPSDQKKALEDVFKQHNDPSFTNKISSVNESIGSSSTSSTTCDSDSRKSSIDNLRSVGIATVISSGNSGNSNGISTPGCISTAITVGATNKAGTSIASYSNLDDYLDLLAPGGLTPSGTSSAVTSSFNLSTDPFLIITSPPFGAIAGTSMAAPHVTGAWAVLKEKHPAATVDDIASALQNNGGSIGGFTLIDLDDALNSIMFCGSPESAFNRIDGTSGNDRIGGTDGRDLVFAGAGNDSVQGYAGDDCIFGEGGNDKLSGGDGDDEISGGPGDDQINGRAGADTLHGNDGDDIISGGTGDDIDTINGNAGNDQLSGRGGNDVIDGGAGIDKCAGGPGSDTITNCESKDQ